MSLTEDWTPCQSNVLTPARLPVWRGVESTFDRASGRDLIRPRVSAGATCRPDGGLLHTDRAGSRSTAQNSAPPRLAEPSRSANRRFSRWRPHRTWMRRRFPLR